MKNLSKEVSLLYLQDRFKTLKTAMLTTYSNTNGFRARPAGTADVDNEGNIWFFTNEYALNVDEISVENTVSLTYSDPHNHTYLSILGKADLVDDKARMIALWTPFIKAFFQEDLDDPKLTLLRVKPVKAEYWDSDPGVAMELFNMTEPPRYEESWLDHW